MSRLAGALGVTACVAMLLAGCGSEPASTQTPPSTLVVPSGLTPAPSDVPEHHDDGSTGTPLAGSTLTLDEDSRTSALDSGMRVMTLFARRDIPAEQWINDLAPHLTLKAAQAYNHTDPTNVPATRITGAPTLTPASTPLVARVSVPTDAGVYLVILSRTDENPTWLADRIMPPEGPGDQR